MTLDKTYELFVRCFNNGDFTPLQKQLRPDAHFSSDDSIYSYTTAQRVLENLNERFGANNPERGQALTGYVLEEGLLGSKRYAYCALIIKDTPQNIVLVVRIQQKRGKIQAIRMLSPKGMTITRGEALTG